jgi:hypothetical protein
MPVGDRKARKPMMPPITMATQIAVGKTRARKLRDAEEGPAGGEQQVAGDGTDRNKRRRRRGVTLTHFARPHPPAGA